VVRIDNNRDKEAQEHGFKSFSGMKKGMCEGFEIRDKDSWKNEIERINKIDL